MKKTEKMKELIRYQLHNCFLFQTLNQICRFLFLHQNCFATFFNLCILLVWHKETGSTVKRKRL
jgi:hypothetical protein